MELLQYNDLLEQNKLDDLPSINLLQEWIWNSDPQEELHPTVLLNTNQLLGLLYCRKMYKLNPSRNTTITIQGNIQLNDCNPQQMTLQQLIDTLDNLCIEWPLYIHTYSNPSSSQIKNVFGFVDQCVTRFGQLVSYAHPPETLNNPLFTQEYNSKLVQLTLPCIRRILNTFLILYRHFYLFSKAIPIPDTPYECAIRRPHIEASMEYFDVLCMHYLIPVGARLRYKNEFRGMYNHISQVMYFHNQGYERMARQSLDEIVKSGDPLQVLPALCELYPEIPVLFEEDHFMHKPKLDKWSWLVVAGRIYLVSKDKTVYYSSNVTSLMQVWVQNNQKP